MSTPGAALLANSGEARRAASQILAESRFHQPGVPGPLHGVLSALGQLLQAPLHAIESLVGNLGALLPGGVTGVWVVFALLMLVAGAAAAGPLTRRSRAVRPSPRTAGTRSGAELERLADAAEAAGRLEESVRLRFRAGLARLSENDAIAGAPTRPTAEISRALGSAQFDSLAHRFDEIAYGASPATVGDLDRQRSEWPQILSAGRPRPPVGDRA